MTYLFSQMGEVMPKFLYRVTLTQEENTELECLPGQQNFLSILCRGWFANKPCKFKEKMRRKITEYEAGHAAFRAFTMITA